jgi:hypothetical protein
MGSIGIVIAIGERKTKVLAGKYLSFPLGLPKIPYLFFRT